MFLFGGLRKEFYEKNGRISMKLSVVIVARNEEKNIARCIESVLKHTAVVGPVEVLLADSASTDRTVEIASIYPINIISLKPEWPLSPSAGRFSGVNNVSGEYVLIIDGDMELLGGWVEEAISFMRINQKAAAVVGRHYDIYYLENGSLSEPCVSRSSAGKNSIRKEPYIFASSIFRRDYLQEVGNFHPFLRAEEEAEISCRLIQKGYDLYFLPYDSIRHYTIPRRSFQETIRRSRRNLWSGMGDMLSWCLRRGYYKILWQRFKVFFSFIFLMLSAICGLTLFVFFGNLGGLIVMFLPGWFWLLMVVKKRSFVDGSLSFINFAVISWSLFLSLFRRVPPIDTYPRDVISVKKM